MNRGKLLCSLCRSRVLLRLKNVMVKFPKCKLIKNTFFEFCIFCLNFGTGNSQITSWKIYPKIQNAETNLLERDPREILNAEYLPGELLPPDIPIEISETRVFCMFLGPTSLLRGWPSIHNPLCLKSSRGNPSSRFDGGDARSTPSSRSGLPGFRPQECTLIWWLLEFAQLSRKYMTRRIAL